MLRVATRTVGSGGEAEDDEAVGFVEELPRPLLLGPTSRVNRWSEKRAV